MYKKYKYETHCHTSESSECSRITGAELIRGYNNAGYSGVVITDHFYNGNCTVSTDLSWDLWVSEFCKGYENALEEARKLDMDLFFGFEFSYLCADFLIYGLSPNYLLNNPDIKNWTIEDYYKHSRDEGGFIIHAHPFREAPYIDENRLFPNSIDAVEVFNGRNIDDQNDKAKIYSDKYNLIKTSGSDSHKCDEIKGHGIVLKKRVRTISEFIQILKSGEYQNV
ncbi:MAG: PHP domain-containing protein [Spirochaetaceae bacterium]